MRVLTLAVLGVLTSDVTLALDMSMGANSPKAACSVLLSTLARIEDAPPNIVKRWYCNHSSIKNEYLYFIAVRTAPGDGNDVDQHHGWFAVARRGTLVLYWNVAVDRLEPIPSDYFARKK